MSWKMLNNWMTTAHLGYLPFWLNANDKRGAVEQIDAGYAPMGGWNDMNGFTLKANNALAYPGDPDLKPLAQLQLRDELVLVYPSDWVAVIQPDRSFRVARID